MSRADQALFAFLAIAYGAANYSYILRPFLNRPESPDLFNTVVSTAYIVACTILVPLLIIEGFKTNNFLQGILLHSFLLLNIIDFAIRYKTAFPAANISSAFDTLWYICIVVISSIFLFGRKQIFEHGSESVGFFSLRGIYAASILASFFLYGLLLNLIGVYKLNDISLIVNIMVTGFFIWVVTNIVSLHISKSIVNANARLLSAWSGSINAVSGENLHFIETTAQTGISEFKGLAESYNHLGKATNELLQERVKNAEMVALAQLSAQVAHDIRSPLAALDVVLKDLSALPQEKQELARGAVGRIGEIARDLLENYKKPAGKKSTIETPVAPHNLKQLIEPILAEKRVQYASKPEIVIEFVNLAGETEANLKPVEFQRIISNLINNAIESFEIRGRVIIELFSLPNHALLKVIDNGKGIPSEILYKLGQKGETHGKDGGNGLGLYHARTTVEGWGGSFKIESEFGKGTAVLLELPHVDVKAASHTAVLLDDDMLVHMNWKMAAKAAKVALKAYNKPEDFAIAMESTPKDTPIYIDSDLDNGIKGEDIAKDLHDKGFSDITMATEHSPEKFAHLTWLKVSGKEPPWAE